MLASEISYWKRMLEGDKTAFFSIYKEYYTSLFQYGFSLTRDKELSKDCIQEMYLELWNTRLTLNNNVADVKAYLFTWLRRKISRTITIRNREKLGENSAITDIEECSYEDLLIAFQSTEKRKRKLATALNNLSKKQLELLRLKFYDNLSYEEIAEKSSLTIRTVYNTIYEALRHLRENVGLLV